MKAMNFDLGIGTSYHFLMLYAKAAADMSAEQISLAQYLVELAMVRYRFIHFRPSKIAAAALKIARDNDALEWSADLVCCSAYKPSELEECEQLLLLEHTRWGKYLALRRKFGRRRFYNVAYTELSDLMHTTASI
jgi:hypothetical protein